ncbi:MAG: hypothetical protein JXB45_00595 [Candidatus Krumholzibacteriota bacterium]|nr:hypothetical protein [Candidatus Krumholzibacteriota bacterium]
MNKQWKQLWCDPGCPFASFPRKEHLDGACHTFIALYCSKHARLVQKSAPCLDLTEETDEKAGS